jgi:hypothetical protein
MLPKSTQIWREWYTLGQQRHSYIGICRHLLFVEAVQAQIVGGEKNCGPERKNRLICRPGATSRDREKREKE